MLFGEEGSDFGIETNAKRIGKVFFPAKYIIAQLSDVMINISTRVSLQWFKLNRKKSATKVTHKINQLATSSKCSLPGHSRSRMKSRLL